MISPSELVTDANVTSFTASGGSKFPHMSHKDVAVWEAFLSVHLFSFDRVIYDVSVGGKAARRIADDHELKVMWKTLIAKRIDAVMFTGNDVLATEVKPVANMSALGQALTYSFLWNSEGRSAIKARPCVVCSKVDDDVEEVYQFYGVLVIVVSLLADGQPAELVKVLGRLPV